MATRYGVVPILLLACAFGAFGQDPWDYQPFSASPAALLRAASAISAPEGAAVLILLDDRSCVFDEQGREVFKRHFIYRVLTPDAVENWSSLGAVWQPWHQARPELRARVITPDGVAHALDPKTIDEAPARGDASRTYLDSKVVRAPLPAVSAGAVVEEEIAIADTAAAFDAGIARFVYFGGANPVRRLRLTVEAPAGVPLRHLARLLPSLEIRRTEQNGRVRLVFEHGPLGVLTEPDSNLPPDVPTIPYIAFSTGKSWQDVATAYSRVVDHQLADAGLEPLIKQAIAGATSPVEIAGRLLIEVRRLIRYTGVEFGEAALVPRTPAEILKRRYGDCKDRAALLVGMLRTAGVPAHLALLNVGPGEDVHPELPGLGQFSHAIVFIPGSPARWADPTDEFARFGELPAGAQDRRALVIRPATESLVKTPEPTSADNGSIETREFFLAELGAARVVETTETWGSVERGYRSFYSRSEPKDVRKSLEEYAKSNYSTTEPPKHELSDARDLSGRYRIRLEMTKAGVGATGAADAAVAIVPDGLVARLPEYFELDEDAARAARKTDFVLSEPFTAEWRYRIVPPPGFRPAALPDSGKQPFGPALLAKEFTASEDGVVTATLRFDTVKRRFSPEEAKALRTAVHELRAAPPILVRYEQVGEALLAAGSIREALVEFHKLAELHPNEALHRVQISKALLAAGAGEDARREARDATRLDPKSGYAFANLGWVLQHDLIGRRFKKGCDLAAAEAAYRHALELDPDDDDIRTALAILLEHAPDGVRYASRSKLEEAIKEYRALEGKIEEENADNILYALLRAGRFGELKELAAKKTGDAASALLVAAFAAQSGPATTIAETARRVSGDQDRRTTFGNAAQQLIGIRMYPQAAELLAAAAKGSPEAASLQARIEVLRKTRRFEELAASDDPATVFRRLFPLVLATQPPPALVDVFTSSSEVRNPGVLNKIRKTTAPHRYALEKAGVPIDVAIDIGASNIQVTTDGDEAAGYRLRAEIAGPGGSFKLTAFVVREQGRLRVRSYNELASVGAEALDRVERGDLGGARRWLDWARELQAPTGGDDPLGGPIFPRFWTKGAADDALRCAAASLMVLEDESGRAAAVLEAGRQRVSGADRLKFDLALAAAYFHLKKWNELFEASRRLLEAQPDSATAFQIGLGALRALRRFDDADALITHRVKRIADDATAIRASTIVAVARGDFKKAVSAGRQLLKAGQATAPDLNDLAWNELLAGAANDETLSIAQRSVTMMGGLDYGTLHTLAAIYAELGKSAEAREAILQAMEVGGEDEPSGATWYVFGRIAEQCGLRSAAIAAYRKVGPPEDELDAASTYRLAQKRLAALADAERRISH